MHTDARVLVVDDHPEMVQMLREALTDSGCQVALATGGAEAIATLRGGRFDAVLCDLRMADVDGMDVLATARALDPDLPVLMMTAFGGVESAVEAMKAGAYDYFTKPFRLDEVLLSVTRAVEARRLRGENRQLRRAASGAVHPTIIGRSEPIRRIVQLIDRVAASPAPVLVRGESGTGKELVARALHDQSPRAARPYVAVNCTALPSSLLESELFGHLKGAFTGATVSRKGLFVEADGGTLFLDEIGDMAPELQARLLRVLQDGQVRAVGADSARKVDVRVIAATHQQLEERVKEGRFRQDLFYRLNVISLTVPPLRDRPEDVPLLIEHFLERSRARNPHSPVRGFSPAAISSLAAQPLEGNVRELENLVERLVVLGVSAEVDLAAVEAQVHRPDAAGHPLAQAQHRLLPLRQLEAEYIAYVIGRCGGNKTRAAELLGIDVSTIHRREKSDPRG